MKSGLYEQIINQGLAESLEKLDQDRVWLQAADESELPQLLSQYAAEVVHRALLLQPKRGAKENHLRAQIELVNRVVESALHEIEAEDPEAYQLILPAQELLALTPEVVEPHLLGRRIAPLRPTSPLRSSSLFTGAKQEPSLDAEFRHEIQSSDRIDMLVSFIKWSGLRLLMDELQAFCQRGGKLRVITTSYMGATDMKAVEALAALDGCELKVSYDTKRTRLHAKTYVFYRETGFSTAYVGSSNLSRVAISSGLEWNVKIAARELPETMQKIAATFDNYWNAEEFEPYHASDYDRLATALRSERVGSQENGIQFFMDIHPYPYQQEILDRLEAERLLHKRFKNLVVAATGTGKTVIAAFDYLRFRRANPGKKSRLLFVAHRQEILRQSVYTFRQVLRDQNFGDLLYSGQRPEQSDYLFMSIQSFNSQNWDELTTADYFDYIIIDEFHHAAASSYQALLAHYKPQILLGLTATPERLDGLDITEVFDGHIAAEIRLPEAIERKLLAPFQYFGVSDTVDLSRLAWTRGSYDISELNKVYTLDAVAANKRANLILGSVHRYVTDVDQVRGLGFCVTVDHAQFMADYFTAHGMPSIALSGRSTEEERIAARERLVSHEIRFIFSVNIYNEGVDIPEVDTVLFLRPTESLTVFLQQLGRGLRLAEDKECLTVLDFIGQAHKRYSFQQKFEALLTNTRKGLKREIEDGFISVPKGSYIKLEKMAERYVLNNISQSFTKRKGLVERIQSFEEESGQPLALEPFLTYHHLKPTDIYRFGKSFSRLAVDAGVQTDFADVAETVLDKAWYRLAKINSLQYLNFIQDTLTEPVLPSFDDLSPREQRFLRMFYYTIYANQPKPPAQEDLYQFVEGISENPTMVAECMELVRYASEQVDFVSKEQDLGFDNPLELHCDYNRDQLLAAFDHKNPSSVREGVIYIEEKKTDILLITLNKSDKDFSPTTMYEDYSISDTLFHWQSQSTTADTSPTGLRYINHRELGSHILLFVREAKVDQYGKAMPYTYLGPADYQSHEGSRPMSITFKMHEPIPARFLKLTDKVQAG